MEALFGPVLRVDHGHWGRTVADLRPLALRAAYLYSRERLLVLRDIARGSCATAVVERTGRRMQTVMDWVHGDDEHGPEALAWRRTGGRPLLRRHCHYPRPENPRRPAKGGPPAGGRG